MGNAPFEYGFFGELVPKCLSHVLDRCVQTTEQGIIERVFRGRILEFPAVFAFDHFYGYGIFIVLFEDLHFLVEQLLERSHHLIHFREFEAGDSCFTEICVSPRGLRLTFSPQA